MGKTDPAILFFALTLIVLLGVPLVIWFSKKYGFANILILLMGIQRYGLAIGFALKPYLIFSLFLFAGSIFQRDMGSRLNNMLKILRPVAVPFFILFSSLLVSGALTGGAIESIRQYALLFWGWMIICSYVLYAQRNKDVVDTCRLLLMIGGVLSIIGVVTYGLYLAGFKSLASGPEGHGFVYKYFNVKIGRLRNLDLDPNAYALYMLPILFTSLGVVFYDKRRRKKILFQTFFVLLILCNLAFTFSRGAVASILITALFALMFAKARPGTKPFFLLAFFGVFCAGVLLSGTGLFDTFVSGFTFRHGFQESRYSLWTKAFDIVAEHFVWGVGQGRITQYLHIQVHNAWLELLAETGIFSFLSMVSVLYVVVWKAMSVYKKLIRRNDDRACLLMGGICGLISMIVMLSSVSLISVIYFWFQIGFLLVMVFVFSREEIYQEDGKGLRE